MTLLAARLLVSSSATGRRALAMPRSKLPARTVKVVCNACDTVLYRYAKNGKGALVKCWEQRILEDFTAGDCRCHGCGQLFARKTMVRGRPAHKIIGGKARAK